MRQMPRIGEILSHALAESVLVDVGTSVLSQTLANALFKAAFLIAALLLVVTFASARASRT